MNKKTKNLLAESPKVPWLDLVVVLGMHRSGTSAITRGLQVLGVDLGSSLIPSAPGNNEKGFWEDIDVYNFDIELLVHLGIDWDHAAPITAHQVNTLCEHGFVLRAATLLRSKLSPGKPFGIKDPRIAKLMPFWQLVFSYCKLHVGYVLVVRNPISVASSLHSRDHFDFEKSYLLWLDHTLTALVSTQGAPRVFVEYDALLRDPSIQLHRMAGALRMSVDSAALENYTAEFLDRGLRHAFHPPDDLAVDVRVPNTVTNLYSMVLEATRCTEYPNFPEIKLAEIQSAVFNLKPTIVYVDKLNADYERLVKAGAERDGRILELNNAIESLVIDRDSQKAGIELLKGSLEKLAHERDEQVSQLNKVVTERDALISNLGQTVESIVIDRDSQKAGIELLQGSLEKLAHERDEQVSQINKVVTERDALISNLGQTVESIVIDRDSQKAGIVLLQGSLEKLAHERDEQLLQLNKVVTERDALISNLGQTVESIVIDRDSQKAGIELLQGSLEKLAHERDEQVSQLNKVVTERDALIRNLGQTVESLVIDRDSQKAGIELLQGSLEKLAHERDEQVSQLNKVVSERDALIRNLGQTVESLVIDRDSQKAGIELLQGSLEKLAHERDEQVSQFNKVATEREYEIDEFRTELTALYKSRSWRLTSPLRWLVRKVSVANRNFLDNSKVNLLSKRSQNQQAIANAQVVEHTPTEKNNPKFRILLVSHYCPTRAHAGGLRILDIYALIRKQCPNVQLDLLTHYRPQIDWSLDASRHVFHNVYLAPTEELNPEALLKLSGSPLNYDVIDLQFHQSGYQIDAFKRIGAKIIFTPMESLAKAAFINLRTNLLTTNSTRLLKVAASLRAAAEEIVFTLKADEAVCVSRADASFLRAITSSRRVRGIDTGVSQFEFADALDPSFIGVNANNRRCNVLFVAYFGSETNVTALRWYLDNVHPIVKARLTGYVLTVVGRGDMSAFLGDKDNSIEFVGEVPAIAPYIQDARIGIAPALSGSGLRGKVNQYAVLGVPSVVSPIAHRGLAYRDGINIFVAEKPEIFAERCVRLLSDFELNDRMGQAARQLCLKNYTWQSKWSAVCSVYNLEKEAAAT